MAVSAVSAIGGAFSPGVLPVRGIGSGGAIGRVQPVPGVVRREDANPESARKKTGGAGGEGEGEGLSRTELERRLGELRAEKSRLGRRQASGRASQDLETARVLSELRARDVHVRGHEAAHVSAGGGYVRGAASFSYQKGPDGRQYAIGGEVGIDTSPISGNPDATAAKMRIVRAAAVAPSDPSPADLAVASAAQQAEIASMAEARAERTAQEAAPEATASRIGDVEGRAAGDRTEAGAPDGGTVSGAGGGRIVSGAAGTAGNAKTTAEAAASSPAEGPAQPRAADAYARESAAAGGAAQAAATTVGGAMPGMGDAVQAAAGSLVDLVA